ncbi:MAG: hypothetical protein SGPRY_002795 [Prymnesium sp.]
MIFITPSSPINDEAEVRERAVAMVTIGEAKVVPEGEEARRAHARRLDSSVEASHRRDAPLGWDKCCLAFQRVWVLDPRSVVFVAYWDILTTLALIWTAVVTPVEVAFVQQPLHTDKWANSLFMINRVIDLLFILDMLLQFRLGFKEDNLHGTRWVVDAKQIARHYACSFWFPLDVFSVLTSLFDLIEVNGAGDLTILRAIRALRLVKLVKLARGSRIFKRWEMRISINYTYFSLFTVITGILLACHWTACIWGLQAAFDPLNSWPGATEYCVPWDPNVDLSCPEGMHCNERTCGEDTETCDGGYACVDGYRLYVYALYWSITTITSVGYGDITATPRNSAEQIVCSFVMLLSGMLQASPQPNLVHNPPPLSSFTRTCTSPYSIAHARRTTHAPHVQGHLTPTTRRNSSLISWYPLQSQLGVPRRRLLLSRRRLPLSPGVSE